MERQLAETNRREPIYDSDEGVYLCQECGRLRPMAIVRNGMNNFRPQPRLACPDCERALEAASTSRYLLSRPDLNEGFPEDGILDAYNASDAWGIRQTESFIYGDADQAVELALKNGASSLSYPTSAIDELADALDRLDTAATLQLAKMTEEEKNLTLRQIAGLMDYRHLRSNREVCYNLIRQWIVAQHHDSHKKGEV